MEKIFEDTKVVIKNRKSTDNAMTPKSTKEQTMTKKSLHRKLKLDNKNPTKTRLNSGVPGYVFPASLVTYAL